MVTLTKSAALPSLTRLEPAAKTIAAVRATSFASKLRESVSSSNVLRLDEAALCDDGARVQTVGTVPAPRKAQTVHAPPDVGLLDVTNGYVPWSTSRRVP